MVFRVSFCVSLWSLRTESGLQEGGEPFPRNEVQLETIELLLRSRKPEEVKLLCLTYPKTPCVKRYVHALWFKRISECLCTGRQSIGVPKRNMYPNIYAYICMYTCAVGTLWGTRGGISRGFRGNVERA